MNPLSSLVIAPPGFVMMGGSRLVLHYCPAAASDHCALFSNSCQRWQEVTQAQVQYDDTALWRYLVSACKFTRRVGCLR